MTLLSFNLHSLTIKFIGDLFLVFKENHVWSYPNGTGHGTPYDYDTYVPLIFAGKALEPRLIHDRIRTVDIAPTIARFLEIEYPANMNGKAENLYSQPQNIRTN